MQVAKNKEAGRGPITDAEAATQRTQKWQIFGPLTDAETAQCLANQKKGLGPVTDAEADGRSHVPEEEWRREKTGPSGMSDVDYESPYGYTAKWGYLYYQTENGRYSYRPGAILPRTRTTPN